MFHRYVGALLLAASGAAGACDATHPNAVVKDCSLEASQEHATNTNAFWTSDLDDLFYSGYCNFDFCQTADQHTGDWWIILQPFKNAAANNVTFSVSQSVTLPNNAQQVLSYWLKIDSCHASTDQLRVYMGATIVKTHNCAVAGYKQIFVDVSAYKNTTKVLKFTGVYGHIDAGLSGTAFVIDDVDISPGAVPVASTTVLAASPNPATPGVGVSLTATVTGSAPTGTVQFLHGATPVTGCTAVALNASHKAVCANVSSLLQAGANAFSAVYSGDANNLTSTGTASVTLNKAASATTLTTACLMTFTAGQPFSMTAAVSGYQPAGNVAFKAGGTAIAGCEAVALGAGNGATCTTNAWTAGVDALTANYAGDGFNSTSNSTALNVEVLDVDDVVFRNFFDTVPPNCPAE
ncbi:MAG TPA: Ig-like domain-containing protein [Rudaea sp.]